MYRRRVHHDIPAPPAETTRNESACTAGARIRTKFPPRQPKQPETKAHALQKHASGQSSRPDGPNDQKRKHMHCRSAHHHKITPTTGPNDQKRKRTHGRSTHQDKIPAPTAQTTRNESTCTAEACIRKKLFTLIHLRKTNYLWKNNKKCIQNAPVDPKKTKSRR